MHCVVKREPGVREVERGKVVVEVAQFVVFSNVELAVPYSAIDLVVRDKQVVETEVGKIHPEG